MTVEDMTRDNKIPKEIRKGLSKKYFISFEDISKYNKSAKGILFYESFKASSIPYWDYQKRPLFDEGL